MEEYILDDENKIWKREPIEVEHLQQLIDTLESEIVQANQVIAEQEGIKTDKQAQIAKFQQLIAECDT